MCYKDMTFCMFHEDCLSGGDCPRALTDKVQEEAVAWWGNDDAPVSVFTDPPKHCFEPKKGSIYEEEYDDELELSDTGQ